MTEWVRMGNIEMEIIGDIFETGWYRHFNGQQADGSWPQWHCNTGRWR